MSRFLIHFQSIQCFLSIILFLYQICSGHLELLHVAILPNYRHLHIHTTPLHPSHNAMGHERIGMHSSTHNIKALLSSLGHSKDAKYDIVLPNTTSHWDFVMYMGETRGLPSCAVRHIFIRDNLIERVSYDPMFGADTTGGSDDSSSPCTFSLVGKLQYTIIRSVLRVNT